jgi:hypothetical protein
VISSSMWDVSTCLAALAPGYSSSPSNNNSKPRGSLSADSIPVNLIVGKLLDVYHSEDNIFDVLLPPPCFNCCVDEGIHYRQEGGV